MFCQRTLKILRNFFSICALATTQKLILNWCSWPKKSKQRMAVLFRIFPRKRILTNCTTGTFQLVNIDQWPEGQVLPHISSSLSSFEPGASSLDVSGILDKFGVIVPVSSSSSSMPIAAAFRLLYGQYPKHRTKATPGIQASGTTIISTIKKYA